MNLVGASRTVIIDQDWNPCNERQAVYRCYRYNQTRPVSVYLLIGMVLCNFKLLLLLLLIMLYY